MGLETIIGIVGALVVGAIVGFFAKKSSDKKLQGTLSMPARCVLARHGDVSLGRAS